MHASQSGYVSKIWVWPYLVQSLQIGPPQGLHQAGQSLLSVQLITAAGPAAWLQAQCDVLALR